MLNEDASIRSPGGVPATVEGPAMLKGDTKYIALSDIVVPPNRLRALKQELVDKIAESFEEVGQLQSIVVSSAAVSADDSHRLISGSHRYEAARKLGWDSIRALIVEDFDADQAQLAEIDENLIRGELSAAENLAHHAARKRIYLRMHPETKAGGDRRSKSHGEILKKPAYIDATAAATGRSRATIAREVSQSDKIADVAALTGTSLDKKGELAALAKLPANEQAPLVEKAKAGEKVSAKRSKAIKVARVEKRKKKVDVPPAQDEAQREGEPNTGDERTHPAVAYLREHLSTEQLAEFFTLVERPNSFGCWSEFGEALAGQPEIGKLIEKCEAAPVSDDEQEQAASLSEEEAPPVAA